MNYPPMMPSPEAQEAVDRSHMQMLAIFYYIMAGFSLLGLAFLGVHYGIMQWAIQHDTSAKEEIPMAVLMGFYAVMGLFIVALGVAEFFAAKFLRQRKYRTFTMIVAGFNCLSFPLGTALGVFTFIVLSRPSVQALYQREAGAA